MVEKGISINQTNSEIPSKATITLSSQEIEDGIVSLKKLTKLPKEGELPLYSDKAATVYLECTPKKMGTFGYRGKHLILPHPLSYNRNICLIVQSVTQLDPASASAYADSMALILREIGIKGEIKVVPVSVIQTAIQNKDVETLTELARIHDTHLADKKSIEKIYRETVQTMDEYDKNLSRVDLRHDPKKCFEEQLAKSALWLNASKDAYVWKVGHCGQTDEQLRENIEEAVKTMERLDRSFVGGLRFFRRLHLRTGFSEEVPIYVDGGVEQAAADEAVPAAEPSPAATSDPDVVPSPEGNEGKRKRAKAGGGSQQDAPDSEAAGKADGKKNKKKKKKRSTTAEADV